MEVVNRRFRGATFKVAPHFLFSPRVVCILLSAAAPVEFTTHREEVAVRYSADLCCFGRRSFT
jgi:hypothetical protein